MNENLKKKFFLKQQKNNFFLKNVKKKFKKLKIKVIIKNKKAVKIKISILLHALITHMITYSNSLF